MPSLTENRSLLQTAAGAEWNRDGVETLSFDDPDDINSGGTAYLYGDSGVVRLELSLPAARAAEVIEYVRSGRITFPIASARIPIEEVLQTLPRGGIAYEAADYSKAPHLAPPGPGQSSELDALIADQARDEAEDLASSDQAGAFLGPDDPIAEDISADRE